MGTWEILFQKFYMAIQLTITNRTIIQFLVDVTLIQNESIFPFHNNLYLWKFHYELGIVFSHTELGHMDDKVRLELVSEVIIWRIQNVYSSQC